MDDIKQEHKPLLEMLSKELERKGTSFEKFLSDSRIELLLAAKPPKKHKFDSSIVTDAGVLDVVFGRGK